MVHHMRALNCMCTSFMCHLYIRGDYFLCKYQWISCLTCCLLLIVIHAVFQQDGETALNCAALHGHTKVVETLLQHGVSVDLQNVVRTL